MENRKVYVSALSSLHDTGNHPENQRRIDVIVSYLRERRVPLVEVVDKADPSDLTVVHSQKYIALIEKLSEGRADFGDNVFVEGTFDAALNAAETSFIGVVNNGFAVVRPPGHHASKERFEGFCFFNNVGYVVERGIREGLFRRPLIVDIDAHYGNGTAALFKDKPEVFYLSLHIDPEKFYPGVRPIISDHQRSVSLSLETDDRAYVSIFRREFEDAVRLHQPDKVVVSVGFDTFYLDSVAGLNIRDPRTYCTIAEVIRSVDLPVAAVLEGGYNLAYLGECAYQFYSGLCGTGDNKN